MNIHFIIHEVFEAPGAYLNWAIERNHKITYSKVYEFDLLPQDVDLIDLLILMGGPQSPFTSKVECEHFDAKAEIALIKSCIEANKAVVGVCLGAQLIGNALGGRFECSPEKEIGVFQIELNQDGLRDSKISHFGSSIMVGHWHSDMPGLTSDAKILATSEGCPRQIVSYSNLVYGFQCHMEFNQDVVELLIAEEEDFLATNTKHQYVQKPEVIRNFNFREMNEKLYFFLNKLELAYKHR